MKIYDVLILGAGASGLMCAANLDKKLRVGIVEGNGEIAKKIKISGGGKCNITNKVLSKDHYDGDKEFLFHVFESFSKEDLLDYLQENGLEVQLRKKRFYFCKNSSDEIIRLFKRALKHIELLLHHEILRVEKEEELFKVWTQKGVLRSKSVVVATGGKSYKKLGASDIGLHIAKYFDLKVKEFTPALVGLSVQKEQFWMKELSGVSLRVTIRIGSEIIEDELLFTHKGISGPAVLSASVYWKKGDIAIDFLPGIDLDAVIRKSKKRLSSVLPLPKRVAKTLLTELGVEDKGCNRLKETERKKLAELHRYTFAPAGNFGFAKAEVSRGGVLTQELDPVSMETLYVKNLYFVGEVVDITGLLGGYNFQWAFSSGAVCAAALNKKILKKY